MKLPKSIKASHAQVSVEFVLLIIVALIVFTALALQAHTMIREQQHSLLLSYAESNIDKIEATIRALSSAGIKDTNTIKIYYPENPYPENICLKTDGSKIYYTINNTRVIERPIEGNFPLQVQIQEEYIQIRPGIIILKLTKSESGAGEVKIIIEEVKLNV